MRRGGRLFCNRVFYGCEVSFQFYRCGCVWGGMLFILNVTLGSF